MKKNVDLKEVLVLDVESTCWESLEEQGIQQSEVIEIGICSLNIETGRINKKLSYIIKPTLSTLSVFCQNLTGISQETVDYGLDLRVALKMIGNDFNIDKNKVWFSYGEYDRKKLSSDVGVNGSLGNLHGISVSENPFAKMHSHFNIKTLMALKENLNKELGLSNALAYYGESFEGVPHSAADDAHNTAKIIMRVLPKS